MIPLSQGAAPWIPALAGDTLRPVNGETNHHEPLLNVKAVETGVIDVSSVVAIRFGF